MAETEHIRKQGYKPVFPFKHGNLQAVLWLSRTNVGPKQGQKINI
jgi:hypothetical protein